MPLIRPLTVIIPDYAHGRQEVVHSISADARITVDAGTRGEIRVFVTGETESFEYRRAYGIIVGKMTETPRSEDPGAPSR